MNSTATAQTDIAYSCKACGARSPQGIGYAEGYRTEFPAPAADCTEHHYGDLVA